MYDSQVASLLHHARVDLEPWTESRTHEPGGNVRETHVAGKRGICDARRRPQQQAAVSVTRAVPEMRRYLETQVRFSF